MRVMHFGPVWQAGGRERVQKRRASRLVSLAILVAALLACIIPQAANAASGFAQSKTDPPFAACPETTSGSPICEAIAVPTVAVSSGEALGSEFQGAGEKGGFDLKDLRAAYKLPETGGSEETVAIVDSHNDPYAESDLQKYREKYKVYYKGTETACTEANGCFKKIDTNGETEKEAKEHSKSFPTESSNSLEISLDIDMVAAACAECHILLVESLGEALTEAEVVGNNLPALEEAYKFTYKSSGKEYKTTEISNSWDVWEGAISEAEQKSDDEKYLDHPGVPITFASGDYGYSGRLRWPGSSQYVISAGATKLTKVEKPKEGERAWTEEPWREYINIYGERTYVGEHGAGTTSGCSKYEAKPEWQKDKEGCGKRTDVDAAVVGACDSPVSIYDTDVGGWYNECGTSDSAPFLAGVEALSTPHSRNLGAQAFYIAGENKTLYDITKGGNGECGDLTGETFTKCHAEYGYESSVECGAPETLHYYLCHALVGYDGPTGWGAPDGALASGPAVTTEAATGVTKTGASLNGTVNPEGVETKYFFEYDTKEYKRGEGPHGTKTAEASAGAGTSNVKESKAITGLAANTKYDFRIVATNSTGTTDGLNQVFTTLPNAPENITLPVASPETPDQAVPESTTTGTWTNSPTSYAYQWDRCNATGGECAAISGGTSSTYTPVEADVKHTLVVKVTAKNIGGESAPASSKATKQVEAIGEITEYSLPSGGGAPEGITAGPDGNLWFTIGYPNKIGKMTPTGEVTEYSGAEEGFSTGIATGLDKNLWVTESDSSKIAKVTTSGAITEYVLPRSGPKRIVSGPDGNLWFTEGIGDIGKITTSGTITEYFVASESSPDGITAGPSKEGALWFTEYRAGKIGKITTAGGVTEYSLPSGREPDAITAGPDGNLWFCDWGKNSAIGKITTSGTITEYSLPEYASPEEIVAGPDGNLWFTEHGKEQITRITTAGVMTTYAVPANSDPKAITVGPEGNIWFADYNSRKLGKITP